MAASRGSTTFFYETKTNAQPFPSNTFNGTISANTPREALDLLVRDRRHQILAGLFCVEIYEHAIKGSARPRSKGTAERGDLVARWLSPTAATLEAAGPGDYTHVKGVIHVNGEPVEKKTEPLVEVFRD